MEETKVYNSKICPECKKEYPKSVISCDECNITLMKKTTYNKKTDDEIYAIKNHTNVNIVRKQRENRKSNVILGIIIVVLLFFMFCGLISVFTKPSEPDTYTCSRCDKTFTDSDNTWSIAYSGFCEKCHEDIEFLRDVQEALN